MSATMLTIDPFTVLSKVALFGDLSEEELRALAHRTVKHHAKGGDIIFNEGDPCEGFYVVESGEVKIFKTAASGREQVLTVDRAGNSIAEIPVFDGGPYPASALATIDTTLLFVSKRDFRTLILEHPEIGLKVLKNVGSRLRRLVALIEELSFTTVRARLVMLLSRLASDGTHTARGTEFTLPPNQEIASQIGTVRELVSRNLSRLQAEGLIRLDGKQVIVPDVTALAATGDEV
ncbi:MAG TPA: Crp/Fnr family transcriptional regulator [Thermoanaerobaculia bacterium]|nr:Crp/Fnr family transcriptional regulator [Thermoanaerobaculia bacterium]